MPVRLHPRPGRPAPGGLRFARLIEAGELSQEPATLPVELAVARHGDGVARLALRAREDARHESVRDIGQHAPHARDARRNPRGPVLWTSDSIDASAFHARTRAAHFGATREETSCAARRKTSISARAASRTRATRSASASVSRASCLLWKIAATRATLVMARGNATRMPARCAARAVVGGRAVPAFAQRRVPPCAMARRSCQGARETGSPAGANPGAGPLGLRLVRTLRRRPGTVRHGCTPREVTIGVFALAFAVRLAWALRVQSPLTAVFSDMGG